MNTFKDRIKQLRIKNNLTLKELGEKLGYSESTMSMYESGKRQPKTAEDYAKIAKYFSVSLDYLLGLSDSPDTISEITVHDMKSIEKDLNKMMEDMEHNPGQGFAAYNGEDIDETDVELFKNALRDALILAKKINKKKYTPKKYRKDDK